MTDIELHAGRARVVIVPDRGGRIGQIELGGEPRLRGPEFARLGWPWWGCFPLIPWSNRIPEGRFEFEGRTLQVPVNFDDGTALHGLTADRPWAVDAADGTTAELSIEVAEGPYEIAARESFRLDGTGLDLRVELTNRAAHRVPVGLGIHPWFRAAPVRVPAERSWPGDGPLPDGPPRPVGADEDLRELREPPEMDRCYTGLTGTTADIGDIRLHWWGPVTQIVVYTATPGWVCVEPVTMANDGFRLAAEGFPGTGVLTLDPGESAAVAYRFQFPLSTGT